VLGKDCMAGSAESLAIASSAFVRLLTPLSEAA
jgi:hypothetical protein